MRSVERLIEFGLNKHFSYMWERNHELSRAHQAVKSSGAISVGNMKNV